MKSRVEDTEQCPTLKMHPIREIMNSKDVIGEVNLQEEDAVAYVQLMDDIDPKSGDPLTTNESFLTQLKRQGLIKKKTAFFDPLGFSNFTDPKGRISGQLTLGGDLDLNAFKQNDTKVANTKVRFVH